MPCSRRSILSNDKGVLPPFFNLYFLLTLVSRVVRIKLIGMVVHSLFVSRIVRVFSVASFIVASLTIAFTHFFSL